MQNVLFSGVWRCKVVRFMELMWFVSGHVAGSRVGICHSVVMDDQGFGARFGRSHPFLGGFSLAGLV